MVLAAQEIQREGVGREEEIVLSPLFIYCVLLFRGSWEKKKRVMKLHSNDKWREGGRADPF